METSSKQKGPRHLHIGSTVVIVIEMCQVNALFLFTDATSYLAQSWMPSSHTYESFTKEMLWIGLCHRQAPQTLHGDTLVAAVSFFHGSSSS